MGWIPFAIALAAKAGSSALKSRAKSKQAKRDRKAQIAALGIGQKQKEDTRRSRVALGNSLLGGVPATTGGGVRTNVGLDPALYEQMMKERTYDFGAAVPEQGGAMSEFLAGLFGDIADTVPYGVGDPNDPNRLQGETRPMQGGPTGGVNQTVNWEDLMKLLGLSGSGTEE